MIMTYLVFEVCEIADELIKNKKISEFEALQIAVKIQHNRVLSDAFMLDTGEPSALEMIAMQLGADNDGDNLKSAIYDIADAIRGNE